MNHYLFTYGMLTNSNVMDQTAQVIGAAKLENWAFELLCFANVRPSFDDVAHGVLWQVDDNVLAQCDRREGHPHLYTRVRVPVLVDGQEYMSWVYTLTESGRSSYLFGTTSDHYVDTVLEGYEQHGVNPTQVLAAEPIENSLVLDQYKNDYIRLT